MQTATTGVNWRSNDFWLTLILLLGSLFGLSQDQGTQIAGTIVGVVGVLGVLRDFFKDAKFVGLRAWLSDTNTWAYIGATVSLFLPQAGALVPALQELSNALLSGNFSKIIVAGLSLITLVYNLFFRKRTT